MAARPRVRDVDRESETAMTRLSRRKSWQMAAVLLIHAPLARGEVVETFQFGDVASFSLAGDAENDIRSVTSTAASPYTAGSVAWSGSASPTSDPDDPTVFPSWGADLAARITHTRSNKQADLLLGSGEEFGPGPRPFAGATRAFNGLQVHPGDTFLLEFFEELDDPFVAPDAVWDSIEFTFSDDFAAPLEPPGPGIVRFQTWGRNTFPTSAGEAGGEFFRIDYGRGDGPAIAEAVLNTHAASPDDLWFDADASAEPPALVGTFQANRLEGIGEPDVEFESQDSSPASTDKFAVLRLSFLAGDFVGGDAIHFGIDTDGGFAGPATGDAFATLSPPLTLTVLFEDGTYVAGDLRQVRRDVDDAALLELDVNERILRADSNADGSVDGGDLLDMLLHFGASPLATLLPGDTDGNGNVDTTDIDVWREQAGLRFPGGTAPSLTVAEPRTAWPVFIFAAYWGIRCRRQLMRRVLRGLPNGLG